jgi:PadR family transcriptional regulator PadR
MKKKSTIPTGKSSNSLKLSAVEEMIITVLVNEEQRKNKSEEGKQQKNKAEMYGLEIIRKISEVSEKHLVSFGSLYPALKRLEDKGLLESRWGDETPDDRGGARRRYYKVTDEGQAALDMIRSIRNSLSEHFPVPA